MKRSDNVLILDGGMGTQLQAAGMAPGENPNVYGLEHPEVVYGIHRAYIEAGSRVLYSNTFGANRKKLEGTGVSVREAIAGNVRTALHAARDAEREGYGRIMTALDLSPIGELLEPYGLLTFEEAYDIFREMVTAGSEAGADLIVIETLTDLYEAKAALLAAKEHADLPVWVTMSFEKNGRTFLGTTVSAMALTLDRLGADAVGMNCSLGPAELLPMIREMCEWTDKPIIVKPNAGLPDPKTGAYSLGAEEFSAAMTGFLPSGIYAMGGCCGTDPSYIRKLAEVIRASEDQKRPEDDFPEAGKRRRGISSASRVSEYGRIHVIGERINPTGKKRLQQALRDADMDYVMQLAIEQQEAGADILDINVGAPGVDEERLMVQVVKAVQSVSDLPLQLDSADPRVLEAGLRVCSGRPLINSVNGERERMDQVFPLARRYGAAVLGLTMDEEGIPETAEKRIEIAERILSEAARYGIPKEDVIIDCLTLTVSAQQEQAAETLRAVRYMHEVLGQHCALGVSNISFGLPMRKHVTVSFLTQALSAGLDFPIINPNSRDNMDAIVAFRTLSGEDPGCAAYISRFAPEEAERKRLLAVQKDAGGKTISAAAVLPEGRSTALDSLEHPEDPLEAAILKGNRPEAERITEALLAEMPGMEIIEGRIIPALDRVGKLYEAEEFFLPQLMNAAGAACAGLDLIKARLREQGGETTSRGRILLATVAGDIHDIGKNIVKVVLENYGYEVIDLGKDVSPERIVETAIRLEVRLIGLSALMTTTVGAMRETIGALRASGHDCRVMVGGAVLTPEFAREIGADYYAKDAAASAEIARAVLG